MALVNSRGREIGEQNENSALVDTFAKAPNVTAGMRVGLLGGSFDPPHEGHVHISLEALKRLQLDQVWWLVSPGNPLKQHGPWPLEQRLRQCVDINEHPRLKITALEVSLGSPYTAQTLKYLTRRYRATRFVWLMGADNMASVHFWRHWQQIFDLVPVAVIDRPGQRHGVKSSLAAHKFAAHRILENHAGALASKTAPAWSVLSVPLHFESSTRIRQKHR